MNNTEQSANEFRSALVAKAHIYEVALTPKIREGLVDYFCLLFQWNPRLHLVAPCSPTEFATRHVLESLLLLPHLPSSATVADIGSGAGLPMVPCLIARPDIRATLFESAKRKAVFLREALKVAAVVDYATVVAKRFEDVQSPPVHFITCRALEKFETTLPRLLEWVPKQSSLLLFGSHNLRRKIDEYKLHYTVFKIPQSINRFIFVVSPGR
ncbi:MAG TPA: RsmG family class I SAM-dependent methyltransferase [Pyrinomonadaceae bacterium]|nr:RsmG family class I SAM-dependent methyltransferase [Pyrinomonadaceae bacterium]